MPLAAFLQAVDLPPRRVRACGRASHGSRQLEPVDGMPARGTHDHATRGRSPLQAKGDALESGPKARQADPARMQQLCGRDWAPGGLRLYYPPVGIRAQ